MAQSAGVPTGRRSGHSSTGPGDEEVSNVNGDENKTLNWTSFLLVFDFEQLRL
jgi:hypothetical protein